MRHSTNLTSTPASGLAPMMVFLAVAVTGCATVAPVVPPADWACVSAGPRSRIDHDGSAELARAEAELTAAQTAVTEARRTLRPVVTTAAAPAAARTAPVDELWASALADHEQRKTDARSRVAAANDTWQRANLAWREQRLAVATAHLPVVRAQLELARASYIDRHLLGTDTYDTAPYRGQLAQVQDRYYAATRSEAAAHDIYTAANARLISAKEEYARLARTPPATEVASAPLHLQLAGFTVDHRKPAVTYLKLR